MKIPYFQVDALTAKPFSGNPAGVCLLDKALSEEMMQKIALENNLPETAYVLKNAEGFDLRWYTPTAEIKLCGHGTIATAHIMWQEGVLDVNDTVRFWTKSGWLTVSKEGEWISMSFPRFSLQPVDLPAPFIQALGVPVVNSLLASDGRYIVEVAREQDVVSMQPDFNILKNYAAVAVTGRDDDSRYDFISRSFAPSHGVNEDPVTGSFHCALAPYWGEKLQKTNLFAFQASERGGELKLELTQDRVLIEGKAVTLIKGYIQELPG